MASKKKGRTTKGRSGKPWSLTPVTASQRDEYIKARKNGRKRHPHQSTQQYGSRACSCGQRAKQRVWSHLRCLPGKGTSKYDKYGAPVCKGGNKNRVTVGMKLGGYARCVPKPNTGLCKGGKTKKAASGSYAKYIRETGW